jgi:hypothetical protein
MRRLVAIVTIVGLIAAGCGGSEREDRLAALAEAEQRWTTAGLTDYTLIVEHGCLCPPEERGPFEVRVVTGAVDDVAHTDATVESPRPREDLLTVEALFEFLRDNAGAHELLVTYDGELGYPRSINVDPIEGAVDDEFFIGATVEKP